MRTFLSGDDENRAIVRIPLLHVHILLVSGSLGCNTGFPFITGGLGLLEPPTREKNFLQFVPTIKTDQINAQNDDSLRFEV